MAQDDTIQDVIERIESARDRCQNAADQQGVRDAEQALADLQGLSPTALPTARDIEEYFNERLATRVTRTQEPRDSVPSIEEPMPFRSTGIGRTRDAARGEDWQNRYSDNS